MRCQKARQKLGSPADPELMEHLKNCASCASLLDADLLIRDGIKEMRQDSFDEATPISLLEARMAAREPQKESKIMAAFRNAVSDHPRATFGILIGALTLIFFVLVPFPYQRTVGYNVQFSGVNAAVQPGDVSKVIEQLDLSPFSLKVMGTPAGNDYILAELPSLPAAKEAAAAFAALTGTSVAPVIIPITETVSGSLYAQARNRLIQIEVKGEGKTDEQIRDEIKAKLEAQGFGGAVVYVKTGADGKRNIELHIEGSDSGSGGPVETIEVDSRGKTNAEIEAEIKAKLAERGHPNADIQIRTEGPDSLRQIEIQIQDTTGR